ILWQYEKGPRFGLSSLRRAEESRFETDLGSGFGHLLCITNRKRQIARAIPEAGKCMSLRSGARADASAISYRGSSGTGGGRHFDGRRLGLVGDQLAQERNQHDQRNTDCEAANAKLRKESRVLCIGGDRRRAGGLGDHSREVTSKQPPEA